MKKKYLVYALLPVFSLALVTGGVAYAHGMYGFGGMSNLTPDQIATNQQNMFQREADLLGMSVDDVKNAWAEGKSFQQLMTEKGVTQDQLRQKMEAQRLTDMKNVLNTLVSKGVITQSQADQRLQVVQQNINNIGTASSTFRGRGMGRGFGGRHGMGMMGGMMNFGF